VLAFQTVDGLSLILLCLFFKLAGAFLAIVSSAIPVSVANSRIAVLVDTADSRILANATMQGALLWGCVCTPFVGGCSGYGWSLQDIAQFVKTSFISTINYPLIRMRPCPAVPPLATSSITALAT
jgi:hypothetical protein